MSVAKKVFFRKAGIFTNFSICSFNVFTKLDFWKNPSILIFFYLACMSTKWIDPEAVR